jgi:hypothetical protein
MQAEREIRSVSDDALAQVIDVNARDLRKFAKHVSIARNGCDNPAFGAAYSVFLPKRRRPALNVNGKLAD